MNKAHIVQISPWPLVVSTRLFKFLFLRVFWWHFQPRKVMLVCFLSLLVLGFAWWGDINKESYLGFHNGFVSEGLRFGMILFILSECMFFFSFFWGFFHNSLAPEGLIGYCWPPYDLSEFLIDPYSVPLLNTVLLLSSGVSITFCHHLLVENKSYKLTVLSLVYTLLLGLVFLWVQVNEYLSAFYSIKTRIYGTVFYMLTGFHGFHVVVGVCCLFICLIRLNLKAVSKAHHVGFECRAWYWHFVDVVWIYLYCFIYWYKFL